MTSTRNSTFPPDTSTQKTSVYQTRDNNASFSLPPSPPSPPSVRNSLVTSNVITGPLNYANNQSFQIANQQNGNIETNNKDSNAEEYFTIRRPKRSSNSYSTLEVTSEIIVEGCLVEGTALLKVSSKKKQQKIFRIDVEQGRILWDSKKSGKVNIESIKELRVGDAIRSYREHFKLSADIEPRWFTIIYVDFGKYKTLHLVAPTLELFNKWVDNLEKLYLHRRDVIGGLGHLRKRHSLWLKQHWKQADKDGDSRLGFDDVSRLCRRLNIHMSNAQLRNKFNDGWLDFADFQRFVKLIKKRDELDKLFNSLAKERGNILTPREFKDFLCTLKEEECDNLYYKFCDKDLKEMNLEGFSSFLMSSDNTVFASEHAKVYQDMSQPLSHYFIDSSHNTYLLGHQLTGESSIEGYIRALQRGCRCVEIDCWDGSDGPIVTHGRTLASKIKFQDVISAIRAYAFKTSPYPIILSFEVHCCIEQQSQMASILRNTLGEYLVTKFLSENETELPSPASLLYKIIIKVGILLLMGKNLPPDLSEDYIDSATDTESSTETESDVESSKEKKVKPKKTKVRVAKALSDLVFYCSSVKFKGFEHHRENSKYYHMSSITDRVSSRLLKSGKAAFIRHNTRHLTRIYPSGFRINSSNFEPHHQWMVGNQLVALNWQTFGMQIDQAMFSVNGRCGYVLKSERLRHPEISSSINTHPQTQTLEIEIISAQQLPKPKDALKGEVVDPFVEVELLIPGAEVVKKRTSTISDNGFNPTWNETLKFTLNCEEMSLVFLRFVVWDEYVRGNDFIASYCIPVASLQFGHRHVPLNDLNGEQYLFTTLFIRSSLEFTPPYLLGLLQFPFSNKTMDTNYVVYKRNRKKERQFHGYNTPRYGYKSMNNYYRSPQKKLRLNDSNVDISQIDSNIDISQIDMKQYYKETFFEDPWANLI
ncbi:4541_t:CDS:10 [Dentiscutata erythropus]|uniref:Phosphoinositide phospholipase C n=1 Tax=Dentiscutata erythropus TaxID=1348616 RepID=A0A9N9ERY0_9GLOM|nr:4541_t:CDS:10 [Dentiscutata erythropus]